MSRGDGITRVPTADGGSKWRARYSYRAPDGSRQHRSKTFRTRQQAQRWRREQLAAIDAGTHFEPQPVTVAEVAAAWLETVERGKAPSTYVQYRHTWTRHVEPQYGHRRLAGVLPSEVQAWYDQLGKRYSAATVRQVHKVLRGICQHAVADGAIRTDPTQGRRLPSDRRQHRDLWTPDEARRFVQVNESEPDAQLFLVLLATGLRLGEALALHWGDVDLEAGTLHVHRTAQTSADGPRLSDMPKTAQSVRTVALSAGAVMALRRQRARNLGSVLVFPGDRGGIKSPARVRDKLVDYCERAGVPKATPHDLRRLCATFMARAGVHVATAAKQLGHSIEVMLAHYTAMGLDVQTEAAASIDAVLRGR